jgi:hypothetical protein
MNKLMIQSGVSKGIDSLLINQKPLGRAQILTFIAFHFCGINHLHLHLSVKAQAICLSKKSVLIIAGRTDLAMTKQCSID